MAPAATAQHSEGAAPPMPKSPSVNGKPSPDLPKPLSSKARRDITSKTDRLIKKRQKLEKALLRKSKGGQNGASREAVLKLSHALARREAQHMRAQNKSIKEMERLHKEDPSVERKTDLELLQTLQSKFKSNLSTSQSGREGPSPHGEDHSDTPSDGSSGNDDEDTDVEVVRESDADFDSSSNQCKSDKDSSAGASRQSTSSNPDGPQPDDHAGERSKKRKRCEEEPLEQSKKEQTTNSRQTTTPGSQSHQPSPSNPGSQDKGAENAGESAAIDSMSQPKKKLKVYGKKSRTKTEGPDVVEDAAISTSDKKVALAKTEYIETETEPEPKPKPKAKAKGSKPPTKSSTACPSTAPKEPLFEPWYTRHARAMMDPEFDDWVHDRPRRKMKRVRSDEVVSGAMPDPQNVVSSGLPFPTPPISSSPKSSPSSSA